MSEKSEILVTCTDQVLKITEAPVLASGGLNEIRVVFSFSDQWEGFAKTAIFYRDEETVYYAVLDENDTCIVPWEVCYEEGAFFFSVFGEKDTTRRTSSVVRYKVRKGAITTDMLPSDPTPAVYDQIMALVATAIEQTKPFREEVEEAVAATKKATADAQAATNAATTSATSAQQAAGSANQAATRVENAVSSANTATEAANTATTATNKARETFLADASTALENVAQTLQDGEGAPPIVGFVTGKVISVKDSADRMLKSLNLYGKTTQDGTPTPNAPAELVSVGNSGQIVLTVTGKNLIPPSADSPSAQGITSYPDEFGTVVLNGTATQEMSRVVSKNFLLPAGTYTLSVKGLHYVDGNKDRVYMNAADGSGTIVNYVMVDKPVTFEMAKSTIVRAAVVLAAGSTYANEAVSIQLEAGTVATEYEPYTEQTITASTPNGLPGIPVSSGGNYTDADGQQWICDEIDFARGVYVKRIDRRIFDGTESTWRRGTFSSGEEISYIYTNDSTIENVDLSKCSHGAFASGGYWSSGYYMASGSGRWQILSNMSIDDWKAYLAEQSANGTPFTVQFPLTTPTETALTAEDLAAFAALHANKPNTTIYNDAGAWIGMEYVADTETYIDYRIAAAVEAYMAERPVSGGTTVRIAEVNLLASKWAGNASPYSQVVTIPSATANSQVDLTPSVEQLAIFHDKDLAFVTENEDGVVTVYAIGDKPMNDYTMQVTIKEVIV